MFPSLSNLPRPIFQRFVIRFDRRVGWLQLEVAHEFQLNCKPRSLSWWWGSGYRIRVDTHREKQVLRFAYPQSRDERAPGPQARSG
jgi:hypothetical protein